MHCPHIRQSQKRSFVSLSTRMIALRSPLGAGADAGGLRSSWVPTAPPPPRPRYTSGEAGTSFFGSTNGIAAVVPTRRPFSESTSSLVPGSESSTGTQT